MSWLIELKELDNLKIIENVMHASLINRMYAMFSCSVMSDSFATPWTVAPRVLLPLWFPQAIILECVAISSSRECF